MGCYIFSESLDQQLSDLDFACHIFLLGGGGGKSFINLGTNVFSKVDGKCDYMPVYSLVIQVERAQIECSL